MLYKLRAFKVNNVAAAWRILESLLWHSGCILLEPGFVVLFHFMACHHTLPLWNGPPHEAIDCVIRKNDQLQGEGKRKNLTSFLFCLFVRRLAVVQMFVDLYRHLRPQLGDVMCC